MEIKRTKCKMPKEFCNYISFTNSNYYKKEIERLEKKIKSYALSKREKTDTRDSLKTTKERLRSRARISLGDSHPPTDSQCYFFVLGFSFCYCF